MGPRAGRWTAHLLERAKHRIGVDISSKCIERCRDRFAAAWIVGFHVHSGSDRSLYGDVATVFES